MAYDANSSYVAPRRAYYGQMQNGHGNQAEEQYGNPYTLQQYNVDIGQNPGQTNGYVQQQPAADRHYDPRYQQRSERGRQANHDQQRVKQAQQTSNGQQRQDQPAKMTMQEWKAKEKARMHAEAMLPDTIAQDNAFPVFPTTRERSKVRGSGSESARASAELPRSSISSEHRHDRKYSKSRTLSESHIPNPADEALRLTRPPVDQKSYSSEQVMDRSVQPLAPAAPQSQSQGAYFGHELSASPVQERTRPGRIPQESQQPLAPAPNEWAHSPAQNNGPSRNHPSHIQNNAQEPPYANQLRQASPIELSAQARTPPPKANVTAQQYGQQAVPGYSNQPIANQQPQSQSRQPLRNFAAPQPIDTTMAFQQPKPAFMDHHPLSPGPVQPRPSTSHAQRPPLGHTVASPMSASSLSQMPQDFNRAGTTELSKPRAQQQFNPENEYGSFGPYDDTRVQTQVPVPPRTREEEIEAEMPDFDSAAPGGTSLLHKRSQGLQEPPKSAPPPMPAVPSQNVSSGTRGFQGQEQYSYNQQPGQMVPSSQRVPNDRQTGPNGEYVYGLPGQNNPRKYGASYDQPPSAQSYQQRPPQPPFANEQPRRSLDDARQMPYRQPPSSSQRFPGNSQAPPSASRQQQPKAPPQPGIERKLTDLSVQTSWSDPPPQDRVGSAPPRQQNFREPQVRPGNGPPATRQLSESERPMPEQRRSDPDSLPQHPTPVRPGHMERGPVQSTRPPPTRNHNNTPQASHQRQASTSNTRATRPVTAAELDQLQAAVNANPNDQKRTMLLIKKLVEASDVLASEGGRADPRTQAKNRERYIMDADKRLRRLVAAGYPDAQFFLADCYGQGAMGLPVNPKEAFTLYQAAAKAGHAQAAYRTAMCCELGPEEGGGTSKDYGKAVQWFRRGAALGDPDAMFKIGIILLKGLLGQPRNIGEAVNFLKRAVEQSAANNPQALYELAQLYESSLTNPEVRNKVVADDKYAFELFKQAAAAGQKGAQFRLGQAYEYGNIGAPIDNRASITWYTKAAAQGEHQAELALSGWYLTGAEGILQQSDTEAYLWARKAASSEPPLAKALFALGYFTETGIGCPKNIEEAKKWYARAAAQRFPKAHERLEELKRSGSKVSKPVNGKLSRKDQKKDEENCVVM